MAHDQVAHGPELYRSVLRLFAEDKLNNEGIAKHLDIGTRHVTPLLHEATAWLLAENQRLRRTVAPTRDRSDLEQKLLKKYPHLKDVYVVTGKEITQAHEYDALLNRWAAMAADYLDRRVDHAAAAGKELHICMSGGETIFEVVNNLPIKNREHVFYYASALIGRYHMVDTSHVDAIANVQVAWSRSGRRQGRCIYATVTPYDLSGSGKSYEERRRMVMEEINSLSENPLIRQSLGDLDRMDIAIVGLGIVTEPANDKLRGVRFSATSLLRSTAHIVAEDLLNDGAQGEIGYCYFDAEGAGNNDKWHFYLTAGDQRKDDARRGVGFYRDMVTKKRDVLVIAGAFKEPAIIAALKGKLFNIWFTNEAAALTVLEAE